MFKLVSTSSDQAIDLQPGRVLIVGRGVTSDIPIYDPTISRRHAEIFLTGTGMRVKDLNSSNGTFVNGARVTEAEAGPSDVITFGKLSFRVTDVTAATERMPRSVVDEVLGESRAERRVKQLGLLLEISKELYKTHELDRLLDKVVDFTFQILNVDQVSILLFDERSGELVPRMSRSRGGGVSAAPYVPQSIARKAVEDRVAILTDNAPTDGGKRIVIQSLRSAMCAPLLGSDQKALGILYMDNQTETHSFTEQDLELLIGVSGLTALAIENAQLLERIRRQGGASHEG